MSPMVLSNVGPMETELETLSKYHCSSTEEAICDEYSYACHNYSPLPIVIARGKDSTVWDPEGNEYIDFLSSFSSVSQGHCNPKLVKALTDQASRLTLTGRAFHNDVFPRFSKFVTELFGYDMVMPTTTGAEAIETAVKISRKWAYKTKKVPENEAIVFSATGNFHGRTMTAVSLSTDPSSRSNYGPLIPNTGATCPSTSQSIRFNNINDLSNALDAHGARTAAFIVEPIQGEAGTVIPSDDYLPKVRDLCSKHNVLLIADEIQAGIARTGRMLSHQWSSIRPDMVVLGKAISGGVVPVSAVLGPREVMLTIESGTHGSTFGGNPLGCAVAMRALELVAEDNLIERANSMGEILRNSILDLKHPLIQSIRGRGLFNALILDESKIKGWTLWDLCLAMKDKGLITKSVAPNLIRLAPPLVITKAEVQKAVSIIASALDEFLKR